MAHRECPEGTACHIRHIAKTRDMSLNAAIQSYSLSSGVPVKTLERWVWPPKMDEGEKGTLKNEGSKKQKSPAELWRDVEKLITKAEKLIERIKLMDIEVPEKTGDVGPWIRQIWMITSVAFEVYYRETENKAVAFNQMANISGIPASTLMKWILIQWEQEKMNRNQESRNVVPLRRNA